MTKSELKLKLIVWAAAGAAVGVLLCVSSVAYILGNTPSTNKVAAEINYNPKGLDFSTADKFSPEMVGALTDCQADQLLLEKGWWRDLQNDVGDEANSADKTAGMRFALHKCSNEDRIITMPSEEKIKEAAKLFEKH